MNREDLDLAWIESLLPEALNPDMASDESRVDSLLAKIAAENQSVPPENDSQLTRPTQTNSNWTQRLVPMGLAASLLLAFFWMVNSYLPTNKALAAVQRALIEQPATREYHVSIINRTKNQQERHRKATLYLDDRDHFVIRHNGLLGIGETWIGGDDRERWIIPPIGPVLTGREAMVGEFLAKKDIDTPYLHLTTILQRMSKVYRLELLPDETLSSDETPAGRSQEASLVPCQHVRGRLNKSAEKLPDVIELWANKESGIAEKLVLQWYTKSKSDMENANPDREWTIRFQGSPELPANWFEYEGHVSSNRRVLTLGKDKELNEWRP